MNERETKLQERTQPTIAGEVRVSASPFFYPLSNKRYELCCWCKNAIGCIDSSGFSHWVCETCDRHIDSIKGVSHF